MSTPKHANVPESYEWVAMCHLKLFPCQIISQNVRLQVRNVANVSLARNGSCTLPLGQPPCYMHSWQPIGEPLKTVLRFQPILALLSYAPYNILLRGVI